TFYGKNQTKYFVTCFDILDTCCSHLAVCPQAWWVTDTVSTDLWGRWEWKDSNWNYTSVINPEDLQAVQATSVLACVFAVLSLFVFVAQLFTLPKGQRFTFTGILQLIACLCVMIAASVYTAKPPPSSQEEGRYGHSYVLAWISFVLTFILAVTYLILRKKSE
uniref:Epithelial membrane protein 1 n=1 Tax=Gasterosteus aculeatus aculeatus TaxID=481459 RepID=A0AAQ4QYA1_GASAC